MNSRSPLFSLPVLSLTVGLLVLACACTTSDPNTRTDNPAGTTTAQNDAPVALRIATYNVSFHRRAQGDLARELADPTSAQPRVIAEVIQTVRPDVVLLNEFDFDAENKGVDLFQSNFLAKSQNGKDPIQFPHVYVVPANTGVHSGMDLDNNGSIDATVGSRGYGGDAFGFGTFPGQYAFAVLSQHPIQFRKARSFQKFLWKDMPNALIPDNPSTPEPNDWFSPDELNAVRLSSKNHIDIPVEVEGRIIHILASHPTPPVFDGPEDRNGKRNHDELRLWADYLSGADYLVDDNGQKGGLPDGEHFAILGDMNADPNDGDSAQNAIQQLLKHPRVNTSKTPSSQGAVAHGKAAGGNNATHASPPEHDTASFSPTQAGNLRLDYALPSKTLTITDAGVFWPAPNTPDASRILGDDPARPASSDHRMVWIDVQVP